MRGQNTFIQSNTSSVFIFIDKNTQTLVINSKQSLILVMKAADYELL